MKLQNKKILVVGGTSGFGSEVAVLAQKAGAQVFVIGRNSQRLKDFLDKNKGLTGQALDASSADELKRYFLNSPNFDHIVSTLGGAMGGGFLNSSITEISRVIEDKFFANLQLAQISHDYLNEHGSIIFTSGSGGHPYDASGAIVGNSAINIMVQGLAVEMAPDFRVNAVSPTWTPTGLWRGLSEKELDEQQKSFSMNVPLKRVASVEEIASGYIYLMKNDFITGQILNIDGGIDLN